MKTIKIVCLSILLSCSLSPAIAQCAMCRQSVESNIDGQDKTVGKGLNKGIIYLMSIPYIVLGGIGYMIYKAKKK
jgi:hypothetical protein